MITVRKGIIGNTEINTRIYLDRYFVDDSGTDFLNSEKICDIYINSLNFDNSKLPSLEKLEIT